MAVTSTSAGRKVGAGLTLVEILATVFIMGLGLIMVAAAFPVGLDQMRQSVEDTQSAMAARSAMEIMRSQNLFQNMYNLSSTEWKAKLGSIATMSKEARRRENLGVFTSTNPTQPIHLNHSDFAFRVWNPLRAAYGGGGPDGYASDEVLAEDDTRNNPCASKTDEDGQGKTLGSMMWPPVSGDLVWRAFLTRLNFGANELPLFRVTIVVCRYTDAGPELYTPADNTARVQGSTWADEVAAPTRWTPTSATYPCSKAWPASRRVSNVGCSAGQVRCSGQSAEIKVMAEGNYILNPKTGFCYRVAKIADDMTWFELADKPGAIPSGTTCPVFSNVVGVYYGLLSG